MSVGETEKNVVMVGQKPVMNYVMACLTNFNAGAERVIVKARGNAISHAVDAVELLRRAFAKDAEIENIEIGTQEMSRPDNSKSNVSTIEISLLKKK